MPQRNFGRPSGEGPTAAGWLLVVVGGIASFVAGASEEPATSMKALAVAQTGLGLGVLLVSIGYLARGIWFLPGREIVHRRTIATRGEKQRCEWCDQYTYDPHIPCSMNKPELMGSFAPKVTNKKCRAVLVSRGFLAENEA